MCDCKEFQETPAKVRRSLTYVLSRAVRDGGILNQMSDGKVCTALYRDGSKRLVGKGKDWGEATRALAQLLLTSQESLSEAD